MLLLSDYNDDPSIIIRATSQTRRETEKRQKHVYWDTGLRYYREVYAT